MPRTELPKHAKIQALVLALASASLCSGCGMVAGLFGKEDPPPLPVAASAPEPMAKPAADGTKLLVPNPESNLQWALQAFEAGNYENALARLDEIAEDGATAPGFELVAYYQGRSLYYLGRHREAIEKLVTFVARNPRTAQANEARLTILLARNTLRDWDGTTTLAAEALEGESYIGNKILIRLLWAEALVERGELGGAKKVILETKPMFGSIPEGSLMGDVLTESKATLAERALWLESHLQARVCAAAAPPAWSKGAKPKALASWYQVRGVCLKRVFDVALPSYTVLGPRWNRAMTDTLGAAVERFFDTPAQAIAAKSWPSPEAVRELGVPGIRKFSYQILSALEGADQSASLPGTVSRPYRGLITKIEQELQKLSLAASRANKSL